MDPQVALLHAEELAEEVSLFQLQTKKGDRWLKGMFEMTGY